MTPAPRLHRRGERGWTTVFVALLFIPLLAFAGLAVDLGAWYAKAADVQRATDAAALAGVPLLATSESGAIAEALRVAELNGYENGVDGVTVTAARVDAQKLQVTISVAEVEQFLTGPFRDSVAITRTSTAEQVQPVPMGSPRNYLGTGGLLPTAIQENFALATNGVCTGREQGDRIASRSDANYGPGYAGCTAGDGGHVVANPEFRPDGYYYAVEVPFGYTGGAFQIQIYDGANCRATPGIGFDSGNNPTTNAPLDLPRTGPHNTVIRVLGNDSLDPTLATQLARHPLTGGTKANSGDTACSVNSGSTANRNPADGSGGLDCTGNRWAFCWRNLHTVSSPTPGVYFIQITPQMPSTIRDEDVNSFALRVASSSGTFTPCSADPADQAAGSNPAYNANCINVYGLRHMGVLANIGTATPSFFLADIGPEHNGKTLEITLFDSGEGASTIQILNPLNSPANFDWQVLCLDSSNPPCPGETTPNAPNGFGVHQNVNVIDVSGSGPAPGPNRASTSRYNDRLLRLSVQLPDDIAADFAGRTWWRIRYTTSGSPTDRTTWSVTVAGDPVRLVPNP